MNKYKGSNINKKASQKLDLGGILKDYGSLLLDNAVGGVEQISGQEIFEPEYENEAFKIAGGVTNSLTNMGRKVASSALMGGTPLMFKGGGQMKKYQQGGDLIEYEGNTHENGGIPLGNTGNEVEDDETNYKDYIFSDTLKVNKQLANEYSLPKKSIGKTFADASKFFDDKDRPNDPYSENMRKKDLTNLKDAQESFKQVELQSELGRLQKKYGGNLYEKGGQIKQPAQPRYNNTVETVRNVEFLQPYLHRSMRGLANVSESPESVYNVFDNLGEEDRSKFAERAYTDYIRDNSKKYQTGGDLLNLNSLLPINDLTSPMSDPAFAGNQMITPFDPAFEGMSETSQMNLPNKSMIPQERPINLNRKSMPDVSPEEPNLQLRTTNNLDNGNIQPSQTNNRFNFNPSALRYAPIATDLATLGMTAFNKPDPVRESMYDTNVEINPNLVNRDQIKRDITSQEGAITNQITEASGGNAGVLLSNLQGTNLNTQKALANANIQADVADQRELARVQGTNLQQQTSNMGRRMQVSDWNARDLGQYNTMLMDSITNVGQNIGNVGTEEYYRNLASQLPIGYTIDRQGNIIKKPTE